MSDIVSQPVLHRQAFTAANINFVDENGTPYVPINVKKRVVTQAGVVITNWTTISGFDNGDSVEITATETAMQDLTLLTDKHIVLIVADQGLATENPLRIIVPIINRELLP